LIQLLHKKRTFVSAPVGSDAPGGFAGREYVLGRAVCHFRQFDLSGTPSREIRSVLRLRLEQWLPFPEAAYDIALQDGVAMVWAWDAALLGQAAGGIAESRLYPAMERDGLRLVQCAAGVEGQLWKGGALRFSRWWPAPPSESQWVQFQRAAGQPPVPAVPVVGRYTMQTRPWGKGYRIDGLQSVPGERLAWFGVVGLAAFLAGWQGLTNYRLSSETEALVEQQHRYGEQVERLLQAKEQTMADLDLLRGQSALRPPHTQLELLNGVLGQFPPPRTVEFEGWHYTPGHLEVILSGESLDPRALVSAFEKVAWAENVTAQKDTAPGSMKVAMDLRGEVGS